MDSEGDPRVHLLLDVVLSALFASFVVWGHAFVGGPAFSWRRVLVGTILLVALTRVVMR